MKVVVTGGAGFIGSAVCRHLIEIGCAVVNIDKLTYAASLASLQAIANHPRYTFYEVDICRGDELESIFYRERPNAVIHLAAESHVDRSISEPEAFITTNLVGTYQLLEAARTYRDTLAGGAADRFRFIHVTTDEVFGSLGLEGLFTERSPYAPRSPYSASKAGSDHLAEAWYHTFDLPIIITNSCNNYGPHQFPEKLIPLAITNALLGRTLPLYGDGRNIRDWLFVEDHARALATLLYCGKPGDRYNVGARSERTNLNVVTAICSYLDDRKPRGDGGSYAEQIRFVSDRPGHDFRYAIDPSKIESETGWRAEQDFESGLIKTIDWYIENVTWWRTIWREDHDDDVHVLTVARRELAAAAPLAPSH